MMNNATFRRLVCSLLFLVLGLMVVSPLAAQEDEGDVTDDDVNRVAKQLFCPTCENTPVDVCPTKTCSDWRDLIRQQLNEGQSDDEILTYFADQYGPQVLANAPREGFGWFLWIAPVVVVLGGTVYFARFMSGLQKASGRGQMGGAEKVQKGEKPAADKTTTADDVDYRAKLEEELRG